MAMKNVFIGALLVFLAFSGVRADVIRLHDGSIMLGKIESVERNEVSIDSFGQKRKVSNNDILKSEQSINGIQSTPLEILLKGGSILKGKIQDYDEEIGVLVNIDFGKITVPVASIEKITDPAQSWAYKGSPFNAGVVGGYYKPLGSFADNFRGSFAGIAFMEMEVGFIRGLYAGVDLMYMHTAYATYDEVRYYLYSVFPFAMYRFVQLRDNWRIFSSLVPFASLGIGGTYILRLDERSVAQSPLAKDLDYSFLVKAGVDYFIIRHIAVRASAFSYLIPQSSSLLTAVGLSAGVLYSF